MRLIAGWVDPVVRDIRFAGRSLRRAPGFTIAAIASLAVGFALAASTFAVLNAYLIRSLPYPAAERLYRVQYAPPGPWEPRGMSSLDWASVSDVVEFPITSLGDTYYLADLRYAQAARGLRVSRGFIEGLGVRAHLGRTFREDDFTDTSERSALLGHALWRDQYGSDPAVVGRVIRAENGSGDHHNFRVVGVLPPDFYYGRDSSEAVDLLVPLTTAARTYMVRLREGVPPGFARSRITDAARRVSPDVPSDWSGVELRSVQDGYVAQLRPVLTGMMIASLLVLVIVCANLAVLVLLRGLRRQKEMAVRTALGADRLQLARMIVSENLLLCVSALVTGLALAGALLARTGPIIEAQLGHPAPAGADALQMDGTVLLIGGAVGLLTALSLSIFPLLTPWQRRLAAALRRDGMTATDGPATRHLRSGLVAFQLAATLVLLIGCGLLIRSVTGMLSTDLGFEPAGLARSRIALRAADYESARASARFYEQFADRLSSATRASVVFANWPPFAELPRQTIHVGGTEGAGLSAGTMAVTADYFRTAGIPLRSGREFTTHDDGDVAVVSETLANRLWPGGNAIGQRMRGVEQTPAGERIGPWRVVVGVAGDVRQGYADAEVGDFYVPLRPSGPFGFFYIRSGQSPSALTTTARRVAAELDRNAIVGPLREIAGQNRELAGMTFLTSLLAGFSGIAGLLAVLGIYGVTAYAVQQRQREIAIRIALGAAAGAVVRLFLQRSSAVVALGLAAGLAGAAWAAPLLEHRLYGVDPLDLWTVVLTSACLAATGLLATWWPARRASRRSPIAVLREG